MAKIKNLEKQLKLIEKIKRTKGDGGRLYNILTAKLGGVPFKKDFKVNGRKFTKPELMKHKELEICHFVACYKMFRVCYGKEKALDIAMGYVAMVNRYFCGRLRLFPYLDLDGIDLTESVLEEFKEFLKLRQ